MSKYFWARFLIFVLVFVLRDCDFELGRNISREESTVNPVWS